MGGVDRNPNNFFKAQKQYGKGNIESYKEQYTDNKGFVRERTSFRQKQSLSSPSTTGTPEMTEQERKKYTGRSSLLGG